MVTALCIWNIYHIYDPLPLLWFCAHLTIFQLNLTSTGIPPLGKEQRTTLQLLVNTFELGLMHQCFWVMLVGLHPKRLVSYEGPGPVKSGTLRHGSRQGLLPRNWVSWTKLHSTMTLFAACLFKLNYIHMFRINQMISSLNLKSHTPEIIWIHVFINLPSYQRAGHGSFGFVRLGKSQIFWNQGYRSQVYGQIPHHQPRVLRIWWSSKGDGEIRECSFKARIKEGTRCPL